ncbi:MAG: hypothetical protein ACK4M7_09885, partial [Burkholderiales bacterium]
AIDNYNNLKRSLITVAEKDNTLAKLKTHTKRGEILAHLVNFKMYRTTNYEDIERQNYELKRVRELLGQHIGFEEVQKLVRNRSVLFQRQLPTHFKQFIEMISKEDEQCQVFLANLNLNAKQFLKQNNVFLNPFKALTAEALFIAKDKDKRKPGTNKEIFKEIKSPQNFESVKLNRKIVRDNCKFMSFLNYLKSSKCEIKKLDVSKIVFSANQWESLMHALSKNKTIIHLNLSKCISKDNLTDYSTDYYAKLANLAQLETLILKDNWIEYRGFKLLLKHNKLKKLEIHNSRIVDWEDPVTIYKIKDNRRLREVIDTLPRVLGIKAEELFNLKPRSLPKGVIGAPLTAPIN